MKRSRKVELILVAAAAAALNNCDQGQRRCVDKNNIVSDPANCQNSSTGHFHWYYGGNSGSAPIGAQVSGGSTDPSASTRGVFGGEGEAHGAGGDAAGHGGGEGAGE